MIRRHQDYTVTIGLLIGVAIAGLYLAGSLAFLAAAAHDPMAAIDHLRSILTASTN